MKEPDKENFMIEWTRDRSVDVIESVYERAGLEQDITCAENDST